MEDTSICTAETSEVSPHFHSPLHVFDYTPLPLWFPGKSGSETKVLMQYYTWAAIIRDVITVTGREKIKPDCARGVPSLPRLPRLPLCVRGSSMLSYSWITISSSIINEVKLLVAC